MLLLFSQFLKLSPQQRAVKAAFVPGGSSSEDHMKSAVSVSGARFVKRREGFRKCVNNDGEVAALVWNSETIVRSLSAAGGEMRDGGSGPSR